ncbi:hypothetical protein Tco_0432410 [Tanacetum coccineum]
MSAMANTTPIVTIVMKSTAKEKTLKETDATPRVNIQDFCEEHYEDILPVIMDKIHIDKRKKVHARLDFEESPKKRRIREGSQNSSVRTLSARARSIDLVILTRQAQLNPDRTDQTPGIVPIVEAALTGGTLLTEIVLGAENVPGRESKSPSSRVSKSGTSDGGYWKSRSKRHKSTDKDDLAVPWICEEQKKYVKDPVKIHNIKQRDEETIEEFMKRFKEKPPLLAKRKVTHHGGHRTSQSGMLQSGGLTSEFKPPPPMVTPVEKRSRNKFCDFHNDKGHSTDECMQLKKQIEELVRVRKLSHLIKEEQPNVGKKEVPAKDKSMAIYMIQPWHRVTRQKLTQSFEHVSEIRFPSLTTSSGIEGPLVIEVEIGGHMIQPAPTRNQEPNGPSNDIVN